MDLTTALTLKPIGFMKSVFHYKNATPRQSSLCDNARGYLNIEKSVFNNPEHSLEGLEGFSHAWVLFIFHKNNNAHSKAKVKPPRLDGQRVGVFSTRSPYRPNNIGLSLLKIDKIQGATIHFSGIDILDGTPIIDIKPYIPQYDVPAPDQLFYATSNSTVTSNDVQLSDLDVTSNVGNTSSNQLHSLIQDNANNSSADSSISSTAMCDKSIAKNITSVSNSAVPGSTNIESCIEEGLTSSSVALNSASSTLQQSTNDCKHFSDSIHESKDKSVDLPPLAELDKQNVINEMESNEIDEEDNMVDFLIGGVINKAASDILETKQSSSTPNDDTNSITNSAQCSQQRFQSPSDAVAVTQISTTDKPRETTGAALCVNNNNSVVTAPWLSKPPVNKVRVIFLSEALHQLKSFDSNAKDSRFRTHLLSDPEDARKAITSILHEEPRSVYRRRKCEDSVYFFALDVLHVTCWFDGDDTVTVLRVKPVADVTHLQEKQ